jgi:hypothetical protein
MTLNELANKYGTDKGDLHHEKHGYAEVYDEILTPFRNREINFVEIGINDPRFPGASIRMWNEYFDKAIYRGLDINLDKTVNRIAMEYGGALLYNVDQVNAQQLYDFAESVPAIDFVVDDGIHTHEAQMTSFKTLFPFLKPGGIYFIEDCHAKDCVNTIGYFTLVGGLVDGEEIKSRVQSPENIAKVEFYNNNKLIVIYKA